MKKFKYISIAIVLLAGVYFAPTTRADIYGSSLVGWWRMDNNDISGTTLLDRSASGKNGTLTNSPVTGAIGKLGQSITFDGISMYIATTFQIQTYAPTNGTVSWWAKVNTLYNDSTDKEPWGQLTVAGTPEFSCQKYTDNNWYCGWNFVGDDDRVVLAASASNWPKGIWAFYTLTYASGGDTVLYMNGKQIGIKSGGTTPRSPLNNFEIGRAGGTYYNGSIDDFRIYNRVLSINEVVQLYLQGNSKHFNRPF